MLAFMQYLSTCLLPSLTSLLQTLSPLTKIKTLYNSDLNMLGKKDCNIFPSIFLKLKTFALYYILKYSLIRLS